MIEAGCPIDEAQRLEALFAYHVLDTAPEAAYDQLTALAANILDVPIALVSLIDEERQWFKSHHGLDVSETPRNIAFCSHAILQDELFEISDARADPRFRDNPLVTGEPHVIFYAGVPLIAPDGHKIGTLCAIDNKPREINDQQREALKILASQVMAQLELRRNIRIKNELFEDQAKLVKRINEKNLELNEFAYRTSHDLKAPLFNIRGLAKCIRNDTEKGDYQEAVNNAEKIALQSQHLENLVTDILALAQADRAELDHEEFDIEYLLDEVYLQHMNLAESFHVTLKKHVKVIKKITGQKVRYLQIISNLVSNSIKYSDPDKDKRFVETTILSDENNITIIVKDNGLGIPEQHQKNIFKPFKRFHSTSASGSGLGLSILEKHLLNLEGSITVHSSDSGTVFEITIPNA